MESPDTEVPRQRARNRRDVATDSGMPEPLRLREFLPYRLSVLTNKVSRAFSARYSKRFGLTIPEWRVTAVLGQEPGLSADQVCARTEMDKVTVSRAVSRLLRKGYLQREFSERDRRRSILRLSRAGRGIYTQIIPLAHEYEALLVEVLSEEEFGQFSRLVERLDRHAGGLLAP